MPNNSSQPALPRQPAPVQPKERLDSIDVLRGLALFGVLAANMASYSGLSRALPPLSEPLNRVVVLLIRFLVEAKFYSLLAMLFGWGVTIQMTRAQTHRTGFVRPYLKRLFWLLIFGALHSTLIWFGDILTYYAILGVPLLLFVKSPPKLLLTAVMVLLCFAILLNLPGETMNTFRGWYENVAAFLHTGKYLTGSYADGSYLEVLALRTQDANQMRANFLYTFSPILAMFLLGLYIGKEKLFFEYDQHHPLWKRVMWGGLLIGAIGNGIYTLLFVHPELLHAEQLRVAQVGVRVVAAPALMLFYVSSILFLTQRTRWRDRLMPLAALGRMSLTNYLMQSVICTLIFYGYGLGLYGQVGSVGGLILTVVIFVGQVRFSEWWLDRHRFGPVEWLWQALTYGYHAVQQSKMDDCARTLVPAKHKRYYIAIAVITIAVLATGGLIFWFTGPRQTNVEIRRDVFQVTPTPSQRQIEPTKPIETPSVRPVPYAPDATIASGNLMALASACDVSAALAEIEILTGAAFAGRDAGSPGGWEAGDHIAEQFTRYGLEPIGDEGTFFQSFPIEYIALAKETRLSVKSPEGTIYNEYVPYRDFATVLRWYAGPGSADAQVVWANNCAKEDFDTTEVTDKIVLCRNQSLQNAQRNAIEHGAAGLLLLADPGERAPDFAIPYYEPWVPKPLPVLYVFPTVIDEILLGSGKSVQDLSISFTPFPLVTHVNMTVSTIGSDACAGTACQGRNVLGVLPGRDPNYASQILVLGAHYDHMGQSPNGTTWAGANDNASGTAVLLEIARTWHEHGYVPRHTVVFAAWDAEEKGLLGSKYYVQHPPYPLENTVAMLQLDMVGAGGETLILDGDERLADKIRALADSLDIETIHTNMGHSDHAPFLAAGCAANLLIWDSSGDQTYHRPTDTVEQIDPDRMSSILKIASLVLLGITEGEPAIQELVAERAAAVASNDMEAFLSTSSPQQQESDRAWLLDLQTLSPSGLDISVHDLDVLGDVATTQVNITFEYPVDQESREQTMRMRARFVSTAAGWRWDGPELIWHEQESGMAVASPPKSQTGLSALGQWAEMQYAEIAALLGLPPESHSALVLFPDAESLRASTALSLPPSQTSWIGPGAARLVYRQEISSSLELSNALAQLVLANAGVTRQAAPWLWDGLPLVLQTQRDRNASSHFQILQRTFAQQGSLPKETRAWAVVEYLRQQLGWKGLGQLIVAISRSCPDTNCQSQDTWHTILSDVRPDRAEGTSDDFETAWQTYWRDRIAAAQTALDTVLITRVQAVLSKDETAFMRTVTPNLPYLQAEQRQWFVDLSYRNPVHFSLSGIPLSLAPDGSMLALVTMEFAFESAATKTFTWQVQFEAGETGLVWAGAPFELLSGDQVRVYYAHELETLAQDLLIKAQTLYAQICTDLQLDEPDDMVIELYAADDAFQASLPLSASETRWLPNWAQTDGSLRLRLTTPALVDTDRSTLALLMSRYLLHTSGIETEWLLRGLGLHLAQKRDGGQTERQVVNDLASLRKAIINQELDHPLAALPAPHLLTTEQNRTANAQAWDTIRFFAQIYGWDKLTSLLHSMQQGLGFETAWQNTLPLVAFTEFETDWMASLVKAHITAHELQIVGSFDPDRAQEHIAVLASTAFAGRQAGSPGAEQAASYIVQQFMECGLMPAVEITTISPGQTAVSFLQSFPISHTTLLSTPHLHVVDENDQVKETLVYRQDFTLPPGTAFGGTKTEELVLVHTPDYGAMDLGGRIVLRLVADTIENEVARAIEHGAGGLILLDKKTSTKSMLSKAPFPVTALPRHTIPVLMLSSKGYDRLLGVVPQKVADTLNTSKTPPALSLGLKLNIAVPLRTPETVTSANVLGLLPGTDPLLAQQVVIVGAHYDHVGNDPDRQYTGQNDNASGVGVLLEIARLWHERGYRPQRSVLFAAWGAQEAGEIGSSYYVTHPTLPLTNTVAVIQLDAVGGGDGFFLQVQGTPEQEGLLRFGFQVAEEHVDGRLALVKPSAQGDHLPFRKLGIPTTLVTWRGASEDNLPDEIADPVQLYRIGVAGRMIAFALMSMTK